MHPSILLSLLCCVISLVSAINFTYPTAGVTLSRGQTYDVTWTTVDTDPAAFSIYLWNFEYFPPYYTFLTQVQTAAQSAEITIPCDVAAEDGWQITAINGTNVYNLFAQTPKFTINGTTCSSPTVGSNPEGTIVTDTVTVTSAKATVTKVKTKSTVIAKTTVTVTTATAVTVVSTTSVASVTSCTSTVTDTKSTSTLTLTVTPSTCPVSTVTKAQSASTITITPSTCPTAAAGAPAAYRRRARG